MVESTGLIEIGHEVIKKKRTKVIRQTQKTAEWIANRNNFNDLLNPEYLPTVMKPKEWTSVEGGAYWTSEMPPLDLVKQKNKRFKQELENFQMPEVYEAVNTFRIRLIGSIVCFTLMNHAWNNDYEWGAILRQI